MAREGEQSEHNKMIKMYVALNRLEDDFLWIRKHGKIKKTTLDA